MGLIRGVRCPRPYCNGNLYDDFNEIKCSLCARWWDNLEDALADKSPQLGDRRKWVGFPRFYQGGKYG